MLGHSTILILALIGMFSVKGQIVTVHGYLRDTVQHKDCAGAVLTLFRTDSSQVATTNSRKDGGFLIQATLPTGKYYLLVSHNEHDRFYKTIVIRDTSTVNLDIILPPKTDNLEAVVVRPVYLPPRARGDTIEYNTANIQLPPNSLVEELLRQLPGLQIDANGNITYNGEKIQRLLVDGEDIFGSNPTIVTRNFDANKIARVQVIERKSDRSLFTGIDDGTRVKTLNLVLKDNVRNSYFGKVEAGGNTKGNYNANGLGALFRGKEQLTGLGLTTNTGVLQADGGGDFAGISFLNSNSDAMGASAGMGIPHFTAMALHYANTWNGAVDHLATNYQYSHFSTNPVAFIESVQTLPDSIYAQKQKNSSGNQQNQHWVYGTYDLSPGRKSAFQVGFYGSHSNSQNEFSSTNSAMFNNSLVNGSSRNIHDIVSQLYVGGNGSWRLSIGENLNRVVTLGAGMSKINNSTEGYLYSLNRYYRASGTLQREDTVDQRKQIRTNTLNANSGIYYSEPLWKGAQLGLNYSLAYVSDNPLQSTFDRGDGKYKLIVDSLSSQIESQQISEEIGITHQAQIGQFNYTIGNSWQVYKYRQHDLYFDTISRIHYTNSSPRALIRYTPVPTMTFVLDYNASMQQPSISQLQTIKNNSDPLHISLGNPNLRPSYNHNFRMDLRRFKTLSLNLGLNLSINSNGISTKTTIDSLGRQVSQPVNVGGSRTAGLTFSAYKKIWGWNVGLQSGAIYARSANYINAELNNTNIYTASGGFNLDRYLAGKYSIQLAATFNYFDAASSVNVAAPVRYWSQSHSGSVVIFLLKEFEMGTNANYTWQQKTSAFTSNTSVLSWNAYINRNFLRNRLVASARLNNILDANSGIARSNTANTYTETHSNVLGRYYMLSLTYHFDKKLANKQ